MRKFDLDTVATWVIAVIALAAVNAGLAESFRSLITWAAAHDYHGVWAYIWPLIVDSFSVFGEVVIFLSIRRKWPWTKRVLPSIAIAFGLGVSVAVNIGVTAGITRDWLTPATHSVAPIGAALMVTIGLSSLKSIIATRPEPVPVVVAEPVPVEVPEPVVETVEAPDEESPDPAPDRPVVPRKAMPSPSQIERAFAGHIKRNELPSMNAVMARLHLGKPRAKAVLAHLEAKMAEAAQVPDIPLPADWERELADI